MQRLTPCIWFINEGEEAAKLYTSAFKNSSIGKSARYGEAGAEVSGQKKGSVMTVDFQIAGQSILALNGGPGVFEHTPSVSLFGICGSVEEVDAIYKKLSPGGKTLMELGEYFFSKRFAFFTDKFGVHWQLIYEPGATQKVIPALLFGGERQGYGPKAIQFYLSLFKNARTLSDRRYEKGEVGKEGTVMHARLSLDGSELAIMDAGHNAPMPASGAISLIINCKDQSEVDYYWEQIGKKGQESQCGWINDEFGVTWQVTPIEMDQLFTGDPAKTERAFAAMLKMKKLDINKLRAAAQ